MNEKEAHYGKSSTIFAIFHNPITAWVILSLSLSLTVIAYFGAKKFVEHRAKDRFEFRATEISNAIQARMLEYEQVLRGGVALFNSLGFADRDTFKNYVKTLKIDHYWPGIQGIGFSLPISEDQKEDHILKIKKEGFPEYTIKPLGKRDSYSTIIYLEPFDWRNKRAFGYDMWSNGMRRQAMKRARDEGIASTSGIITLVQETETDVQKGFLTYLPVYKNKDIPKTLKKRREEFMGWVYSPFRMNDLMKGILGSKDAEINFTIYDSLTNTPEALLYNSQRAQDQSTDVPSFTRRDNFKLQGRDWSVYFSSEVSDKQISEQQQTIYVLIVGGVVNLLLFYVIHSIHYLQKKALAIASEMTIELRKRGRELQIISDEAEKANKAKSQFLATMSHELRTPLNSILLLSELFVNKYEKIKKEKAIEYSKTINSSGTHLLNLINDILDISKIEAGKFQAKVSDINLNSFIDELRERIEPLANNKGVEFKIQTIGLSDSSIIKTDHTALTQVLSNLFNNSIKFTKKGHVYVTIQLTKDKQYISKPSLKEHEELYEFKIIDTGIGMTQEELEKVFDAFVQADSSMSRHYEGTGLGLTIVKGLIAEIGGEMTVHSQPSEGSQFYVYLPKSITNQEANHD